jgi:hypothetical protein
MKALKDRASTYHVEHPEVYELFKRFAFEVIDAGYDNYSARGIFHRMRWHTEIEMSGERFKINSTHSPYYARKFHQDFPIYRGFFRTRVLGDMKSIAPNTPLDRALSGKGYPELGQHPIG